MWGFTKLHFNSPGSNFAHCPTVGQLCSSSECACVSSDYPGHGSGQKTIEAEVKRLAVHQMYKLVSNLFGRQKMKTLTLPLSLAEKGA